MQSNSPFNLWYKHMQGKLEINWQLMRSLQGLHSRHPFGDWGFLKFFTRSQNPGSTFEESRILMFFLDFELFVAESQILKSFLWTFPYLGTDCFIIMFLLFSYPSLCTERGEVSDIARQRSSWRSWWSTVYWCF